MESLDSKILAAIIAGLIAAVISFVGLIITKEQKVSEFRQSWIDEIRKDISDLIGHLGQYDVSWNIIHKPSDKKSIEHFISETNINFHEMIVLINRIKLRLNPKKDKDFILKLDELEIFISSYDKLNTENLHITLTEEFYQLSHQLLKNEWDRVKDGEPIFKYSKYTFGITIFTVIVYTSSTYIYNLYIGQ